MRYAIGLGMILAVFVAGIVVGEFIRLAYDAAELAQCHESKRMALDAAAAQAILTAPTQRECAEAQQAEMERAGYRAVGFEGVR